MSPNGPLEPPRRDDAQIALGTGPSDAIEPSPAGVVRIPVIEQSLDIAKRVVAHGGYRVTKRVDAVEHVVDEALRRQTVHIERVPIGRLLDGLTPPSSRQEGDTIVVPVVKEVLVTEKRLMLVEEVRVRRVDAEDRDPQTFVLNEESIVIERVDAGSPA